MIGYLIPGALPPADGHSVLIDRSDRAPRAARVFIKLLESERRVEPIDVRRVIRENLGTLGIVLVNFVAPDFTICDEPSYRPSYWANPLVERRFENRADFFDGLYVGRADREGEGGSLIEYPGAVLRWHEHSGPWWFDWGHFGSCLLALSATFSHCVILNLLQGFGEQWHKDFEWTVSLQFLQAIWVYPQVTARLRPTRLA